jgi:hypothetical protein
MGWIRASQSRIGASGNRAHLSPRTLSLSINRYFLGTLSYNTNIGHRQLVIDWHFGHQIIHHSLNQHSIASTQRTNTGHIYYRRPRHPHLICRSQLHHQIIAVHKCRNINLTIRRFCVRYAGAHRHGITISLAPTAQPRI